MPNVTFSIDEDLLRQSKMAALQMDASLNAVVRTLLDGFVKSVGSPKANTGNYRKLLDFSLGRVPYRKLMSELHIESDEDLFLMMCSVGLPMPTLSKEELEKTSQIFESLSGG
ncbi:MAG: hypothetical protein K9K38_04590 [Rhodoferax sp.]|nr:hypothetical protein [Rhodoferax sp.]